MKIGIIKEGKIPPDERVPLSPEQCKEIKEKYPSVNIVVQQSDVRRIKASEYEAQGIEVVDNVDDCDVLIGVKEVPIKDLIPNKTYFFFSHTIKKQSYNRDLLRTMIDKHISMVDYEAITNSKGVRTIGFGRYAGIVGCYNTFYAYGQKTGTYNLKRAYQCSDRAEMESELTKVKLPEHFKIILTGSGRVSHGAQEILKKLNLKEVTPKEILLNSYEEPVYAVLQIENYNKRKDGADYTRQDFYNDPTPFESTFMKFAKVADLYLACHFWDNKAPYIFTREDAKSPDFNIKVVGDISCDIDGPVACTIRPSTVLDPVYAYDAQSEKEVSCSDPNSICVIAVDNLPCELPKDASADFGREFINNVMPHLVNDKEGVIERATICKNGDLTPKYEYLRDYVNGDVIA